MSEDHAPEILDDEPLPSPEASRLADALVSSPAALRDLGIPDRHNDRPAPAVVPAERRLH